MPNSKTPFIYTLKHKMFGTLATSSSGSSTAPAIVNHGVHKITAASTYVLQGPEVGSLVTIYAVGVDAYITSKTSSGGQCAFNGMGGTQVLGLLYDSTVGNDPCVTLIGEATTQWRLMNFNGNGVYATSNAGISITT
jgi:hypothetical protein